jgi:hypothetical protein
MLCHKPKSELYLQLMIRFGAVGACRAETRENRQELGGNRRLLVKIVTQVLQIWFLGVILERADFFRGPHGFERARDDLGGASPAHVIWGFRFEQLGVCEDDTELVVQAVKEETKFRRFFHRSPGDQLLDTGRRAHQA